ncbi:MAG: putative kinase [Candidatus Azotimanducaceae bacterium]|jgi:predicted kinase
MYELVQLNIAQLIAPIDSPRLEGFVNNLDRINLLAERSPGYRWRLQTEDGDATSIQDFGADKIVNLTVWTNIVALRQFVYFSAHIDILKRKQEWFQPMKTASQVMWWVKAGHRPDTKEANEKLTLLRTNGPGPEAFTFKQPFPSPGDEPLLHMICGLPGAGKTTLAKQLAATLPATRYCPDEWITRLPHEPATLPALRDEVEALQWQQAQLQLAVNSSVILENGFWTREDRMRYLKQANTGGVAVTLHYLDVPISTLKQRVRDRNQNLSAGTFAVNESDLDLWGDEFEPPTEEEISLFQGYKQY